MPLRKLLLRLMLVALGLTAIAGAGAVLTGGNDVAWRIVGTMLAAAVAAGLMTPVTFLLDKPKLQVIALVGLALVGVEFVLTLGLIWDVFDRIGSWRLSQSVGFTMFFSALVGLPMLLMLWLTTRPASRIAGVTGTVLGLIVFALLMMASWLPSATVSDDRLYGIAGVLSAFGSLIIASLIGIGVPPSRWWRWIGIAAGIIGALAGCYAVWAAASDGSSIFVCITSVAVMVAHANLCMLANLTATWQRVIRISTIITAIGTALIIDAAAISKVDELLLFAAALSIIAGCGSLAMVVLAAMNRKVVQAEELADITSLTLICPGCRKKQDVPVGASHCTGCGLKFNIQLIQPRCPKCDYLLFMRSSDNCPECGTLVA